MWTKCLYICKQSCRFKFNRFPQNVQPRGRRLRRVGFDAKGGCFEPNFLRTLPNLAHKLMTRLWETAMSQWVVCFFSSYPTMGTGKYFQQRCLPKITYEEAYTSTDHDILHFIICQRALNEPSRHYFTCSHTLSLEIRGRCPLTNLRIARMRRRVITHALPPIEL